MPQSVQHVLHASLQTLQNSLVQFACVFGLLFGGGILLTLISRWTQNTFSQFRFPKFGLYVFGIIGIPVHELCHALFAKLFFHKIEKIKWFDPKGKNGSYGTVTHYYNEKNFYHRLGLFFIGMGPVLLAPLFLYFAYHGLLPKNQVLEASLLNPLKSFTAFGGTLLRLQNWSSLGFYGFLYLTVCITSQMELSPDDFKIARGGIFPFFVLFVGVNAVCALFQTQLHEKFALFVGRGLMLWAGFFVLAVLIALANLLVCVIVMNIFNKLTGAEGINPFRG